MQIEQDYAHIISGVRHGYTLGSPIGMTMENRDWANWTDTMSVTPTEADFQRVARLRPGQADLPGTMKYGFDDVRNVLERASARETAARVAASCRSSISTCGLTSSLSEVSTHKSMRQSIGPPWRIPRCVAPTRMPVRK